MATSSDSRRRSVRRGMIRQRFSNTRRSFLALYSRGVHEDANDRNKKAITHSKVSDSSAISSSTEAAIWAMPFKINACTLHMACTVLPKCRPWWIKGSPAWLAAMILLGNLHAKSRTYGVFLFASLRALTDSWLCTLGGASSSGIERYRRVH